VTAVPPHPSRLKSQPAVSVIVPNYNHARFLRERIEGILNQTFQDFEIILLDDCSTDESGSILRTYATHPKVSHLVVNERNTGSPCTQWNRGITLAAGEFVWIAESDDFADTRLLEVLTKLLSRHPNAVVAYSESTLIDEDGLRLPSPALPTTAPQGISRNAATMSGRDMLLHHLRHENVIPNASAVLFRASAAKQTEMPFGYRFCGDWLFWSRLLCKGDVVHSSEALNYFRCHSSTTRATAGSAASRKRVTEALQVVHEIHHVLLHDVVKPVISDAWFVSDWKFAHARLPWFVLRQSGISWSLRWAFFTLAMKYRMWWGLVWLGSMVPFVRAGYRSARRVLARLP